ncbi:hypothetical protein R1T16_05580 [Flavobacterium sp. DG1-102-2]|uniref:hypothetical protein n=1 Tax=Flavobacterium sp. DG1-102-2 TaxID=3081663 RepID=UPI002949C367|nr:hypothetical protein [Flavobacterium sp. DG1-102-2]MDV6167886.1 hypothetical protein [Flavobacterium sp. DG1-102-2]
MKIGYILKDCSAPNVEGFEKVVTEFGSVAQKWRDGEIINYIIEINNMQDTDEFREAAKKYR